MSFRFVGRGLSTLLAAVAALCLALPAVADAQSSEREGSGASAVSEKELDSFAKSYVRLAEVRRAYAKKLEDADGAEAKKVQQEAEEKAVKVLGDEGLSTEKYVGILNAVNSDEELRGKALAKIQKQR